MKAEEINIDLDELKKFKKRNFEKRLNFVKFLADYVKTHDDEEWSEGQNSLINSQLNKNI